ncbi:MAG: glycosyltransferase family 4 protein [Candidatus Omnitrophica bacterium]|nr:glycosyltransferase family 4 protein [Candidatus Omnitrophota bacterium]
MKSVLIVSNFLSTAGYTYGVCEELAKRLQITGWSVITTSNKPNRLMRLVDMATTAWQQRNEYEVAQVDVFSGPAFFWTEAVCWTLRRAGKPYILTLHGGNLPQFARRYPRRVSRLLNLAAAVTTPSRYLLKQMKVYRQDIQLIPNAIDLSWYRFRLRQQVQPQLIWLRAFHSIYNPSLAPRMLAQLLLDFPDIHLTMIGPDKGDGSLQETQHITKILCLNNHITFVGGVPKTAVPEWLNKGDIFINTTNVDNTPVSVLEAMASGLCVVSTNVGGIPYLLEHEKDALLVPSDDPEAMAKAVHRILTEPELVVRLSANARNKVQHFDWSVVLPQWERLLETVKGVSQHA